MIRYKIASGKNPIEGNVLYYASSYITGNVGLDTIAQNITDNCTVTIHDIRGVLSALQEHILKNIADGKSVRFGMLGSFHPTMITDTVGNMADFSPALIKKVNCRFVPSSKLRYALSMKNPRMRFKLDKEEEKVPKPEPGGEQTV